jgi:hypothetical protein
MVYFVLLSLGAVLSDFFLGGGGVVSLSLRAYFVSLSLMAKESQTGKKGQP